MDRFWAKVDKTGECWLWLAFKTSTGYGKFTDVTEKSKKAYAHRFSWVLHFGPIPEGMHVCHTCDVRHCVNPAHLFLGSNADNHADKVAKGRQARGVSHGHDKLKAAQVIEIRKLYEQGHTGEALAKLFGVVPTQIRRIARRQRWKHLMEPA